MSFLDQFHNSIPGTPYMPSVLGNPLWEPPTREVTLNPEQVSSIREEHYASSLDTMFGVEFRREKLTINTQAYSSTIIKRSDLEWDNPRIASEAFYGDPQGTERTKISIPVHPNGVKDSRFNLVLIDEAHLDEGLTGGFFYPEFMGEPLLYSNAMMLPIYWDSII